MKQITEKDLEIEYKAETGHDAIKDQNSFFLWVQEKYLKLRNELEAAEDYIHGITCDCIMDDELFLSHIKETIEKGYE